jgi:hypothetical protein
MNEANFRRLMKRGFPALRHLDLSTAARPLADAAMDIIGKLLLLTDNPRIVCDSKKQSAFIFLCRGEHLLEGCISGSGCVKTLKCSTVCV